MKQWYSAKELACIPGLPKTKSGVIRKAKSENWESRPRQGRGGGNEYPIDCLPAETRAWLARQQTNESLQAGAIEGRKLALAERMTEAQKQAAREAGLLKTTAIKGKAKLRVEAKTLILAARDEFMRSFHGGKINATQQFCVDYNNGLIELPDWVKEVIPDVCVATLYRWVKRAADEGTAGLSGHYGHRKGSSKIDRQAILKEFVVGMLREYPHIAYSVLYKAMLTRFADSAIDLPSKRALERWAGNWKAENADAYLATVNPDEWKNKRMLAFGDAAGHIQRLNQEWQLDGTPADILLADGRYSITALVDVYSRRAKMLVTKTAISVANAQLMRKGILDWGMPEVAKTDNGSDYTSLHMRRVLLGLGIEQHLSNPFSPWEKPFVERFFRNFSHDVLELLPGYIGHDVAERSAIEARKAFSDRLFKKDHAIEIKMTAAEFQQFCDNWCERIYHQQPHSGLNGKTPAQMAAEWPEPLRMVKNERALDLLLQPVVGGSGDGLRTIGKKGIKIGGIYYIAPELAAWSIEHPDEKVLCLQDPDDFGRILVYGDEEFVCVARSDYEGLARQEVAAKAKQLQQKAVTEAKRELKQIAKKANVKDIADEMLAAAAEQSNVTRLPVGDSHTTPALEAAAAADRARRGEMLETDEQLQERRQLRAESKKQQAEIRQIEMNDVQKWRLWKRLDKRLANGEAISPQEVEFYNDFKTTATWRNFKRTEDDLTLAREANN